MSVDGIWYVKLEDGDVERVTLDQLDEWFQSGRITENTMVLADGSEQWTKLAELLGLSDAAPGPAPVEPVHAAPQPAAPVQTAAPLGPVMSSPSPAPVAHPVMAQAAPVMARSPVAPVRGYHPGAPHGMPVGAPAGVPAGARPMGPSPVLPAPVLGMRPPVGAPSVPVVNSVRPVTFDLGADAGDSPFRKPSRKKWAVAALAAVAAAGVGGFLVMSQAASTSPAPPVFAAANVADPTPTPPSAPATPTPNGSPDRASAGPSSIMDPTMRLTDDQKQKLLEADRKSKLHASGGGGGSTWHAPKEKSTGFTTGGNKYDPLNSSL